MHVGGRIPVEPAAVARLRATGLRCTDRRPVVGGRIDADKMRSIAAAAEAQGASLRVLGPQQAFGLAAVADRAVRTESADVAWQAELQHWVGGVRPLDTGLPAAVIPHGVTPTTVVSRDFGHFGAKVITEAHDRTAIFAILYGSADRTLDWLRAGEALSAAWLTATELEVSVRPFSAIIEVPTTRETMRHLLDDAGYPFLLLRFGVLDPSAAGAPRTPRLSTALTVERIND
jgi:hypothetical protein